MGEEAYNKALAISTTTADIVCLAGAVKNTVKGIRDAKAAKGMPEEVPTEVPKIEEPNLAEIEKQADLEGEFARKDMAIKYDWKDDCGKVVTYRVKDGVELICPAGPIGPQIDLGVDMYLPGNSSLTQYDLFNGLGRINRTDFIEVVPGSIKRIK